MTGKMDVKNEGENLWHGQSSLSVWSTFSMPLPLRQDVPALPRWGMQGLLSPSGALPQKTREHQGYIWIGSGSLLRMVPVFQAFPLDQADQQGAQHWAPEKVGSELVGVLDLLGCSTFVPSALTASAVSVLRLGGGFTGTGSGSEVLTSVFAHCDLHEAALPLPAGFFSTKSWPSCVKLTLGSQILWDLSSALHHTCYMTLYKSLNLPAVQFSLLANEGDNCSMSHCSGNLHALRR